MARKRTHAEIKPTSSTLKQSAAIQSPAGLSEKVSQTTVRSAVDALLKDHSKSEQKRARRAVAQGKAGPIVDTEAFVILCITLKQPPFKDRLRPDAIRLKHSLALDDDEVLLIVKDPQRLVKDYLAEHGNGGVTRILGVDKLRKRYGTHEARRELLQQYDHFLVDNRVAPMMPNLLGKPFLSAKKMPISVDMQRDVVSCIQRALSSTSFCPRRGTSTSVRVARLEFEAEAIVENICDAIAGVVKKVAGGWEGIQSLLIKSNKSPALPIFLGVPGWVDPHAQNKDDSSNERSMLEQAKTAHDEGNEVEDDKESEREGETLDSKGRERKGRRSSFRKR